MRLVIWLEASSAQNNMAAVSDEGSTVWVLMRCLNSSCRRSMPLVVRALFHWLAGSRVKVNRRSPASSRLSATGLCRTPYRQNVNLTCEPISSSLDHRHPSRFFIRNGPTASTIHSKRLVSSLSAVAISTAFAQGCPSHNLMAVDQDLVTNSRGVSVVVTQEPA